MNAIIKNIRDVLLFTNVHKIPAKLIQDFMKTKMAKEYILKC